MSTFVIKPDGRFKHGWDLLVIVVTLFVCVEVPLRIVTSYTPSGLLTYSGFFVTAVFLADMALRFRTASYINGKWVDDPKAISEDYMKSDFQNDLLATIPFELIAVTLLGDSPAFTLLNLFRFIRLSTLMHFTNKVQESHLANPIALKIVALLFWVFLVAHWISCGWLALGATSPDFDALTNYNRALYWCITTLATVGYGDITPQTNIQRVYTMGVMIIGAGFYGFIIGNVANILAKRDVAKMHHLEKMERVGAFMRYRNIPQNIQQRIKNYYTYLWESRLGYDETSVLSDLPANLKEEVALHLNREIIEKVAIFKGATEELIRDLVVQLRPTVFTPGDAIFKAGEIGENMYFICRGKVEIVSRDLKVVYATLSDGGFFGEAALLTSQPRNATVRAVDYCDMYTLDKASFDRVLGFYPSFAKHIHELAEERANAAKAAQKAS